MLFSVDHDPLLLGLFLLELVFMNHLNEANAICLLRTWFKSSLCVPALLNTFSFVALSAHQTRNILRKNHISAAAILFVISLLTVQLSHPYSITDHNYVFKIFILVFSEMFLSFMIGFNLLNASFASAILVLTSGKYFLWALILYPR